MSNNLHIYSLSLALLSGCPAYAVSNTDPCLAFDMPSVDTILNSSKKVFAHYFYPFPLSIDNLPSSRDYYTVNYLSPQGEGGKFLSAGGFLRARPLPVSPKSGPNWQMLNMEQEIRMAIARGINGWTFDI